MISVNQEKVFAKIYHPFMVKILTKLGIEKKFLIPMKGIYKNLTANFILKCGTLSAFLLNLMRQICLFSLLLFSTALEVLVSAMKPGKKVMKFGKEEVNHLCSQIMESYNSKIQMNVQSLKINKLI